ncbi:50S ribosomal protein L17 [Maribellus mangrovi]|uniref:50S ribosomal protein L17 n=1 Tax=Maribellus mangrovi TaxID=3133146 RepID=UPI003F584285
MRHNKKFNHLGRKSAHRKAMLANMASSLIEHKRISTTVAKAKALRMYVEPLITKAKNDTTHSRRIVFSYLQDKNAVSELFRDVAVKVADRPGGYTRILKTGTRLGDNADMCIIELVDYNEAMLAAKEEAAKPKKRRSRRGGKKSADTAAPVAETKVEETKVEATKEEAPKAEVVEETKAEETPAAEVEVKAEDVAEEPKAEADEEDKASNEEDKKKEE